MFAAEHIQYSHTNSFSKIVNDYLSQSPDLRPFYNELPDLNGIKEVIRQRQLGKDIDRITLMQVLNDQYRSVSATDAVRVNIAALSESNSFTIVTAHQPNLFTGPLYFIYKILHTVKLSRFLKEQLPSYNFVPVFYMGSEDADLAELNHFTVKGKRYEWKTDQKGAVGRMAIDKKVIGLIDELEQQVGIEPYGKEIISMLRNCYQTGVSIQQATFLMVNELLGEYGVIVLIADDSRLKKQMLKVFEQDIFEQIPSQIVSKTSLRLNEKYNVQAHPREINLFYLKDHIRERIVSVNDHFIVHGTNISFTKEMLIEELELHPERFSPNVILRGLYQESILPNLVFIGGGGEMAYWLQLKDLFKHYGVVFPVLVLRNSFLIVDRSAAEKIGKLNFSVGDFFQNESYLMNRVVEMNSTNQVSLNGNFEMADELFERIGLQAGSVDPTLAKHVAAIKARSLKTLKELEKKMLRAEKRKFSDQKRQIENIKAKLFPKNGLQERVENIAGFYAHFGPRIIEEIYRYSLALEQEFVIISEE
jgi:bacillithiol biosynthesis cysteine-adding enzyme BshC